MGPSIWQLLIIFLIVLLLFGAKRLRNVGGDLGAAIKGFRGAMKEGEDGKEKKADAPVERISETEKESTQERVIEGEVTRKENDKT